MATFPPTVPKDVTIGGQTYTADMSTFAKDEVVIRAEVHDPDKGGKLRLVYRFSEDPKLEVAQTVYSPWEDWNQNGVRLRVPVTGLKVNTHYYGRLRSQDSSQKFSTNYKEVNFWTDRAPDAPTLRSPEDLSSIPDTLNITFLWKFVDPDANNEKQNGWQHRYRQVAPLGAPTHPWIILASHPTSKVEQFEVSAASRTFTPNNSYEWSVRTKDTQDVWGPWATAFRFSITGSTKAPTLISPIQNRAVPVDVPVEFNWRYNDPVAPFEPQHHADIQWRAVGGNGAWTTTPGNAAQPGAAQSWQFPAGLFAPGVQYEWQVKTWNLSTSSDWSVSGFFWSMLTPGSGLVPNPLPDENSTPAPPLGCGNNRVYVYDRGAQRLVGEILPATSITWNRKRDDISTCNITTNGFGWDCGEMLKNLRSFQQELVVFRDGVRVWEGPITRIAYYTDRVEIEARDVMTYVYRRIMRQGYNDSYQLVGKGMTPNPKDGTQVGLKSVVERAGLIITDALVYDDPNVLPYLTIVSTSTDAKQSRIVPPYSRSAWEEVDDLAATAGLDYVTVGRRIILWDTHNRIGVLPEMRDGDFSDSPVVTEYGMNLANYYVVTNNSGVYGDARAAGDTTGEKKPLYYGWVEQIASAYGESTGGASTTLTSEAQAELVAKLKDQARRGIAARWPGPVIVRVPDNSTLNPEVNVGINQLIPGVHIPLRASNTLRPIAQMQKLDSVTVSQDENGEKVQVIMAPAPGVLEDPDADAAAEEAAG